MSENHCRPIPTVYEIRVSGRISPELADWLGDAIMVVPGEPSRTAVTSLRLPVADQSALFGVLARIRDLGLKLVSVNQVEPELDFGTEQQ